MAKAVIYNAAGDKTGEAELSPKVFEIKPSADVIYQAVTAERSNARNNVAHTKTRGEVAGSGRKPWKQKGTGNARAGSIRSPIWRHGGITFGPRSNRNYTKKLNRSMFRKSVSMVLTQKLIDGKLVVIDALPIDQIKTKQAAALIAGLAAKANFANKSVSIIVPAHSKVIHASFRNIPHVQILSLKDVSAYRLLNSDTAVIVKGALPALEKQLTK